MQSEILISFELEFWLSHFVCFLHWQSDTTIGVEPKWATFLLMSSCTRFWNEPPTRLIEQATNYKKTGSLYSRFYFLYSGKVYIKLPIWYLLHSKIKADVPLLSLLPSARVPLIYAEFLMAFNLMLWCSLQGKV